MQPHRNFLVTCKWLLLISLFSPGLLSAQSEPCEATTEKPCIVQDTNAANSSVLWLREPSLISSSYQGNISGLNELNVSASAIPHQQGWQEVIGYINEKTGHSTDDITILDLRQESHGYLNGEAITLTDIHNWINVGKSRQQVIIDEKNWLTQIKAKHKLAGVLTPRQFQEKKFDEGKTVKIKQVESEEELVTRLGLQYYRLTVTDHRGPTDEEVDAFVHFIKKLPPNAWIHLHCRGGKGRSTSFLAMFDMLKNADKASLHDILERHASIPPYYDLTNIIRMDVELIPYYQERLVFLNNFYHYAQQSLAGYPGGWLQWQTSSLAN